MVGSDASCLVLLWAATIERGESFYTATINVDAEEREDVMMDEWRTELGKGEEKEN